MYLQVPYATLICSAFGSPPATSQIRQKLTEDYILSVSPDGKILQWAEFMATSARSNVSESVAFQLFVDIASGIFNQIPNCKVSFATNPSATPLSDRRNTSRPDAHVVYSTENKIHWFDIVTPFEFKKTKDRSPKHDVSRKWFS